MAPSLPGRQSSLGSPGCATGAKRRVIACNGRPTRTLAALLTVEFRKVHGRPPVVWMARGVRAS
jgi:hypothetical protein